jgi:hypothetical protein
LAVVARRIPNDAARASLAATSQGSLVDYPASMRALGKLKSTEGAILQLACAVDISISDIIAERAKSMSDNIQSLLSPCEHRHLR